MLEAALRTLHGFAGIASVHDFGLIHESPYGHAHIRISAAIERWDGHFWFEIRSDIGREASFRKTRVVKWAYGKDCPLDGLDRVIADLKTIARLPGSAELVDDRTLIGRLADRMIRRDFLGVYALKSPIPRDHGFTVTASFSRYAGDLQVILTEKAPSHTQTPAPAQIPHAAFRPLLETVREYLD